MRSFSKLTIGLAIYIVISASFMLQAWKFLVGTIGNEAIKFIFFSLFFLVALSYMAYIFRRKIPVFRIALSILIFAFAYMLILNQPYFTEKIHVLEYGILGYLAFRDLSKRYKKIFKNILLAIFFISAIGTLDETFQKFLPYRVGEIRDVLTNVVSGLLGIFQYFIYRGSAA